MIENDELIDQDQMPPDNIKEETPPACRRGDTIADEGYFEVLGGKKIEAVSPGYQQGDKTNENSCSGMAEELQKKASSQRILHGGRETSIPKSMRKRRRRVTLEKNPRQSVLMGVT